MSHLGGFTRVRAITSLTLLLLLCAAALSSRLNARGADAVLQRTGCASLTKSARMWVLRTSLTTPDQHLGAGAAARDHGFNTLFVQVRGRGDAYFLGGSRAARRRSCCDSRKGSTRSRRCSAWRMPPGCACTRGSTST